MLPFCKCEYNEKKETHFYERQVSLLLWLTLFPNHKMFLVKLSLWKRLLWLHFLGVCNAGEYLWRTHLFSLGVTCSFFWRVQRIHTVFFFLLLILSYLYFNEDVVQLNFHAYLIFSKQYVYNYSSKTSTKLDKSNHDDCGSNPGQLSGRQI